MSIPTRDKKGKIIIPTKRPTIDCGKSRTKQADKDLCDVNRIMKQYKRSGTIEHLEQREPFYGDVTPFLGYQDALDKVSKAHTTFMAMEPQIRARFKNDPNKMIEFLNDETNLQEAIELGMVQRKPPPEEKYDPAVNKPPVETKTEIPPEKATTG